MRGRHLVGQQAGGEGTHGGNLEQACFAFEGQQPTAPPRQSVSADRKKVYGRLESSRK
jgi:hypothetical protein